MKAAKGWATPLKTSAAISARLISLISFLPFARELLAREPKRAAALPFSSFRGASAATDDRRQRRREKKTLKGPRNVRNLKGVARSAGNEGRDEAAEKIIILLVHAANERLPIRNREDNWTKYFDEGKRFKIAPIDESRSLVFLYDQIIRSERSQQKGYSIKDVTTVEK